VLHQCAGLGRRELATLHLLGDLHPLLRRGIGLHGIHSCNVNPLTLLPMHLHLGDNE
jgi:hypothetical protein